jgi:hypothetical protein
MNALYLIVKNRSALRKALELFRLIGDLKTSSFVQKCLCAAPGGLLAGMGGLLRLI